MKESQPKIYDKITRARLEDIKKMDLAIEIKSPIYDGRIFFCSDNTMAELVYDGIESSVCYTMDELELIIEKNETNPSLLGKIHDIKSVFERVNIIQ